MTTPVEKRNASKFCEFHGEVGHTTYECMHLKRQIEEMLKAGKLSHLIKELKQNNWKDQAKAAKNRETSEKDKPLAIQMGRRMRRKVLWSSKSRWGGHFVHRMYVDRRSSSEILYEHCFNRFRSEVRSQMVPAATPLIAISIQRDHRKAESKENPGSSVHGSRNAKVSSDRRNKEDQKELCGLLRRNLDIFSLKPTDMTGVLRHITEHMLNIREGCLPVRQKKRGHAPERNKAICKEVEKLVDAGIMKEFHYHSWLSNPVMVKKHDGSWRMCVDFKDLNKACPKDGYPLSEIDWEVESLCGMREGTFLGYNVNADGIKVCLDKVEAVLSLPSPKCLKNVQKLNGKLASLNRFLSKSAEKSLPFFKL
ncbi:hypothetical protein Tco_1215539 [Tanacetum coccineum]